MSGRPFLLSQLVTTRCNLSCPFCLWKNNAGAEMTTEELMKLYDEAHELGFRGAFFWGGEPLLRPDIATLLQHVKRKSWYVTMATNGTFLPQKAAEIAPFVDALIVSIDHPKDHDTIRGLPGTFENCLEGARNVKAANPKISLVFSCVLTKHNYDVIEELAELAKKEGAIFLLQNMDRGKTPAGPSNLSHDVTTEQRDKVMALIRNKKKAGYPIINSYSYLKHYTSPEKTFDCRCQRLYLTIDAIGNIIDCTKEQPLINVKAGLKQAMDSAAYKEFLQRADKCGICRDAGTLETTYFYTLRLEPFLNIIRNAMR